MKLKSIPALLATAATLAALTGTALFAIGGSLAQASQPHASQRQAVSNASKSTVVSTRHGKLGTFLVGPNGHTLYLWKADPKNHSTCAGACASVWPPLMVSGQLKAAGGVKSSLLGSIARKGGRQATYNGWPLYYYETDTKADQTTGEGSDSFGAEWLVLSTSGKGIDG